MPNWTNNKIIGKREVLEQFLSPNKEFDFNKLIPMPEELKLEAGGIENEAVVAYYLSLDEQQQKALKDELSLKEYYYYSSYAEVYLSQNAIQLAKKRNPDGFPTEYIGIGLKYISNIRKYGWSQWYNWCCANWGTKWNPTDTHVSEVNEDGNIVIEFATAWSEPFGIIIKLAEYFNDGEFHWEYQNEDPDPTTIHIVEKVNGKIVEILESDEEYENFLEGSAALS